MEMEILGQFGDGRCLGFVDVYVESAQERGDGRGRHGLIFFCFFLVPASDVELLMMSKAAEFWGLSSGVECCRGGLVYDAY